jgi:hypothetical protein
MATLGIIIAILIASAGIFIFIYEMLFETGILHRIHEKRAHTKKMRKIILRRTNRAPLAPETTTVTEHPAERLITVEVAE